MADARVIQGNGFEFEPPAGWARRSDPPWLAFDGPRGEVLRVSGATLAGRGSHAERLELRQRTVASHLEAMRRLLVAPNATVLLPVSPVPAEGVERWDSAMACDAGATFLGQTLLASATAVLRITIEGPQRPETVAAFRAFLARVHPSLTAP